MPDEVPQENAPSTVGDTQNNPPQPDGAYGIPQDPKPEETVTLKVPATETEEDPEDSPESAGSDGEGTGEGAGTGEPDNGSHGAGDPAEDQEEASGPVVSNNPDSQTVTMPDGTVVYTRQHGYPISNNELQKYELTHQGDQLRYPYVPGDQGYNPYSDPKIPNSHSAQMVERDIASYAERVLTDKNARVSPMWDAFNGIYEGELDQAIASGGGSGKVEA